MKNIDTKNLNKFTYNYVPEFPNPSQKVINDFILKSHQ